MKFFHVYNERCYEGLTKNNLINEDTGFKIQHSFAMPSEYKFNSIAAKGTRLHSMIKNDRIPFYVDRITGGITYHKYAFDPELIREYEAILGNWFLGFQLHESASNITGSDWPAILSAMGSEGPYDLSELKERLASPFAVTPDGERLHSLSHGDPEYYAPLRFPHSPEEFMEQVVKNYTMRMEETLGNLLPCDSYYLLSRLHNKMGMKTFMPEVGWQIADMRVAVALARATAKHSGKTWGTYYETWLCDSETAAGASMPCYNDDPSNEWYLTQELHPDDFTGHGSAGGSSRRLQKRIYYFSLMSGADYFAEEWGLNCSYTDMNTFELSEYGLAKKEFIEFARGHKTVKAHTPFAIVLPTEYYCVRVHNPFRIHGLGEHRSTYMTFPITDSQMRFNAHVEDVLKLIYGRFGDAFGNEGHVITNSRFGDLFDIIYADAGDEVFSKYEMLIDASPDGTFANSHGKRFRILTSEDFDRLERDIHLASREILPVWVDSLHWLISTDGEGRRYLSIFNNEGNFRARPVGDTVDKNADRSVKISFRTESELKPVFLSASDIKVQRLDGSDYSVDMPATEFAIFEF